MKYVLLTLVIFIAGCTKGMVSVQAIDSPMQEVMDRHDAYVEGDDSLHSAQRKTYLRTTELLRRVMAEAKENK